VRSRSEHAVVVSVVLFAVACGSAKKGPEPPRPGATPSLLDDLGRRCALVVSCSDVHDASQFRDPAACVDWWLVNEQDEKPLADCMMHATTCAAVHACTHESADRAAAAYCLAHPSVFSACDGTRFISCEGDEGRESTLVDCAGLGGTCVEQSEAGLVVRGCASPRLCPAGAPERRCEAGALVSCEAGIVERRACPRSTRCVARPDENGTPSATCEAEGAIRCTSAASTTCKGDVAFACVVNGGYAGLHRTNCADYGLVCAMRGARSSCVSAGPAACSAGPARCDGDALVFCAAGREMRVSCKSLGLGECSVDAKGPVAACRTADL
jgi:hypothetical protein